MKYFFLGLLLVLLTLKNVLSNEVISGIEKNWNNIKSMSGQFEQIDSDGNTSFGNFFFLKPYKSKFEYEDRYEDIITNKSLMLLVDKEGFQIESYAIGNSVLKKLLSDNIKINNEFDIVSLKEEDKFYKLLLTTKGGPTDSKIQFTFDRSSLDLKKWDIYDEFGNKTVFKFTKIKKNIFISQNLFVVKYN